MKEPRRVYSEDNLSGWIERKNQVPYYQMLEEITENIALLFPEDETFNPHKIEKIYTFPLRYQGLYNKLVSGITLLHHPHRIMDKGYYVSDQEDNLLAFRLMQPLTIPDTLLRRKSKKVYVICKNYFGYKPFTFRQAFQRVRIPISSLRRHFIALENCQYIVKIGGDKKNGYLYEAVK